ncbi:sulfotransferase family 2 domain-containing protein [Prosthecomicrobium sp. N25]|uniref:sulfotransferase family 2 domain-containing protein n=1 Tax=Prosthecomicrobium sp. N25 TaxID=3129254 RepID=UPI003076C7E4
MPIMSRKGINVLFMHIPKTGGTAIANAFRKTDVRVSLLSTQLHGTSPHRFPCSPQHFHAEAVRHLFADGYFDLRVTVVRHPVDRILSEYRMHMRSVLAAGVAIPDFAIWLDFFLRRSREEPYVKDNHLRPQVNFVEPGTEVFRYEDGLAPVISRISEVLGLPRPPSADRVNVGADVRADVGPDCLARIRNHYAADFERFGYGAWTGAGRLPAAAVREPAMRVG